MRFHPAVLLLAPPAPERARRLARALRSARRLAARGRTRTFGSSSWTHRDPLSRNHERERPRHPRAIARSCALVLALAAGCASRHEFAITSQPPGAEVRLDDTRIGTTPLMVDFGAYGVRRVTFHKEGYLSRSERVDLKAPWYAHFPLDVVTEVLLPFGWTDHRELHVVLTPGRESLSRPALRSVLERAEILRRAGPDGPHDFPAPATREIPALEEGKKP